MRKNLKNTGIVILAWFLAMVAYSLINKVKDPDYLWQIFLIPAAFLGIIVFMAGLFEHRLKDYRRISILFVITAIIIDQGIKIWLFSTEWQNINIALIPPVFHINPAHNTLGSYLWVLLDLKKASHLLNVIMVVLLASLFIEYWRFYRDQRRNSIWLISFIHFFIAGAVCNLIDNIFHGGSLDYLTIKPFYTFDLKDMYISLSVLFILVETFDNKLYRKDTHINRDFKDYVKEDIRRIRKSKNK